MAHCSDCLYYEVCEAYMMTVSFEVDDGVCILFDRRDEWSKIVRCEDCVSLLEEDGCMRCRFHDEEVEPTDFCSYGERRCD